MLWCSGRFNCLEWFALWRNVRTKAQTSWFTSWTLLESFVQAFIFIVIFHGLGTKIDWARALVSTPVGTRSVDSSSRPRIFSYYYVQSLAPKTHNTLAMGPFQQGAYVRSFCGHIPYILLRFTSFVFVDLVTKNIPTFFRILHRNYENVRVENGSTNQRFYELNSFYYRSKQFINKSLTKFTPHWTIHR